MSPANWWYDEDTGWHVCGDCEERQFGSEDALFQHLRMSSDHIWCEGEQILLSCFCARDVACVNDRLLTSFRSDRLQSATENSILTNPVRITTSTRVLISTATSATPTSTVATTSATTTRNHTSSVTVATKCTTPRRISQGTLHGTAQVTSDASRLLTISGWFVLSPFCSTCPIDPFVFTAHEFIRSSRRHHRLSYRMRTKVHFVLCRDNSPREWRMLVWYRPSASELLRSSMGPSWIHHEGPSCASCPSFILFECTSSSPAPCRD